MALSSISGGENLKKFLGKIKNQTGQIDAGFFPEAIYDDGTQVAQVAFDNCFGHINRGRAAEIYGEVIPARNFMQKTYDENNQKWRKIIFNHVLEGKDIFDIKKALESVAFIIKKDIQDEIDYFAESAEPRNGPKIIALKGFDSPLIWSGKMRESVETMVKT